MKAFLRIRTLKKLNFLGFIEVAWKRRAIKFMEAKIYNVYGARLNNEVFVLRKSQGQRGVEDECE